MAGMLDERRGRDRHARSAILAKEKRPSPAGFYNRGDRASRWLAGVARPGAWAWWRAAFSRAPPLALAI